MVVKPPVRYQVCVQCGWREEQGHRWDRRRLIYRSFWRSTQCPECGGELIRECPQCQASIEDPDKTECPNCGTPYPWPAK